MATVSCLGRLKEIVKELILELGWGEEMGGSIKNARMGPVDSKLNSVHRKIRAQ